MVVKLLVTKGEDEGKIFYVRPGETKILGRSSKADFTLRDMGVSRLHCQIKNYGERCTIADMNSKNGTALNNVRILDETPVPDRAVIEIGTTVFSVRLLPDEMAPREATARVPSTAPAEPEVEIPPIETVQPLATTSSPPAQTAEESPESVMGSFERWLEQPPAPEAPPSAKMEEPPEPLKLDLEEEPDPRVGQVIGGYRVERRIGEDALSTIYEAFQLSMERKVTLKILADEMAKDKIAVERFIRAAHAAGRLSHPNIVQVYDSGKAGDLYYVALERVEGKSLQEVLREHGPHNLLPLKQVLEIGEQIASALEHAHSQGVVHRDIKLSNILITPHGIAKLADVGFAKSFGDAARKRGTLSGERLGTLGFAAPEQLRDAASAGPLSDIYSLGMVLLTLLTGRLPYEGNSEAEVLEKVLLGQRAPTLQQNPNVPKEVAAIVDKATNPDPRKRFGSGGEFASALRAVRERL